MKINSKTIQILNEKAVEDFDTANFALKMLDLGESYGWLNRRVVIKCADGEWHDAYELFKKLGM